MPSLNAIPPLRSFSLPSARRCAPGDKDVTMRLDIALHRADAPLEPGTIAIQNEAVTRLARSVRAWAQASTTLRDLLAALPAFIGDVVDVLREALVVLATTVAQRGRTLQHTLADIIQRLST